MKYSDILVTPLHGSRYLNMKVVKYKDIIVPKGYITNGADIPRVFWSYIPPNLSDILPAVVIHDYMCDKAKEYKDYVKADKYFKEILYLLDVERHRQFTLSNAVKLYTSTIRRL